MPGLKHRYTEIRLKKFHPKDPYFCPHNYERQARKQILTLFNAFGMHLMGNRRLVMSVPLFQHASVCPIVGNEISQKAVIGHERNSLKHVLADSYSMGLWIG